MSLVKYKLYDNLFFNMKKEKIYFINKDMRIEYRPIQDINPNDTYYNNVFGFFAFVYDGNVIEYTKRVEKFWEIISYIGNLFNILLTIFRIINNHFSNRILFVDIFNNFFFEKMMKNNNKFVHLDNSSFFALSKNKTNSLKLYSKAQEKSINSNLNFNSVFEERVIENKKKIINLNSLNYDNKTGVKNMLSIKSKKSEMEKIHFLKVIKLYYLCPLCLIKNKNNLNYIYSINNSICNTFSIENYIDFIKTTKNLNKIKKEKLHDFNYERRIKNNYTDKNLKEEINKIFNK